jgi:hypothetical protein
MAATVFDELKCLGCRFEILRGEFRLFRNFLKRRDFSFVLSKQIERMKTAENCIWRDADEMDSVLQGYFAEGLCRETFSSKQNKGIQNE